MTQLGQPDPQTPDTSESSDDALLSIRNLRVVFPGVDGDFVAVEDLSFDVAPGETLAIVGESGSGKSVTAKSIMRLVEFMNGEIRNGSIVFHPPGGEACDLVRLSEDRLRGLRGKAMALVFQEPMTSLNPVLTIGEQIVEVILLHEAMSRSAATERALDALQQVRIPEAARRAASISARTLRRDAPARHDRHGARLQTRPAHRRRTDDGPRCDHTGRNPGSFESAATGNRHGGAIHHA